MNRVQLVKIIRYEFIQNLNVSKKQLTKPNTDIRLLFHFSRLKTKN